jgi:hypothetical protein
VAGSHTDTTRTTLARSAVACLCRASRQAALSTRPASCALATSSSRSPASSRCAENTTTTTTATTKEQQQEIKKRKNTSSFRLCGRGAEIRPFHTASFLPFISQGEWVPLRTSSKQEAARHLQAATAAPIISLVVAENVEGFLFYSELQANKNRKVFVFKNGKRKRKQEKDGKRGE